MEHLVADMRELYELIYDGESYVDQVHQDLLDTLEGHFARKLAEKEINQNGTK